MRLIKKEVDSPEDEVIYLYHTKDNPIVAKIEELSLCELKDVVGFDENGGRIVQSVDINCFYIEDSKVLLRTDDCLFRTKYRLYELESGLPTNFVRINKSVIINSKKIKRFDASLGEDLR